MSPFCISALPSIRIAFFREHPVQFRHLLNRKVTVLSRFSHRNRDQFFLLNIGERVFLIGKIAQRHTFIPYRTTRTKIYSSCSIADLADNVASFILYAMHHAVVPILYIFFSYFKAHDRPVPKGLQEGLQGILV